MSTKYCKYWQEIIIDSKPICNTCQINCMHSKQQKENYLYER